MHFLQNKTWRFRARVSASLCLFLASFLAQLPFLNAEVTSKGPVLLLHRAPGDGLYSRRGAVQLSPLERLEYPNVTFSPNVRRIAPASRFAFCDEHSIAMHTDDAAPLFVDAVIVGALNVRGQEVAENPTCFILSRKVVGVRLMDVDPQTVVVDTVPADITEVVEYLDVVDFDIEQAMMDLPSPSAAGSAAETDLDPRGFLEPERVPVLGHGWDPEKLPEPDSKEVVQAQDKEEKAADGDKLLSTWNKEMKNGTLDVQGLKAESNIGGKVQFFPTFVFRVRPIINIQVKKTEGSNLPRVTIAMFGLRGNFDVGVKVGFYTEAKASWKQRVNLLSELGPIGNSLTKTGGTFFLYGMPLWYGAQAELLLEGRAEMGSRLDVYCEVKTSGNAQVTAGFNRTNITEQEGYELVEAKEPLKVKPVFHCVARSGCEAKVYLGIRAQGAYSLGFGPWRYEHMDKRLTDDKSGIVTVTAPSFHLRTEGGMRMPSGGLVKSIAPHFSCDACKVGSPVLPIAFQPLKFDANVGIHFAGKLRDWMRKWIGRYGTEKPLGKPWVATTPWTSCKGLPFSLATNMLQGVCCFVDKEKTIDIPIPDWPFERDNATTPSPSPTPSPTTPSPARYELDRPMTAIPLSFEATPPVLGGMGGEEEDMGWEGTEWEGGEELVLA